MIGQDVWECELFGIRTNKTENLVALRLTLSQSCVSLFSTREEAERVIDRLVKAKEAASEDLSVVPVHLEYDSIPEEKAP